MTDTVIEKNQKTENLTEWAQYQSRDNRGYNQLTFFLKEAPFIYLLKDFLNRILLVSAKHHFWTNLLKSKNREKIDWKNKT